ncbi:MAG: DUF167 domain-containing protein [Nanoarchaeota archaeon]
MIVNVSVKVNSNENKLIRISETEYIAEVKEPAEKNKANAELIRMLSKEFNSSYKKIRIKNPRFRKKIVEIDL